MLNCNLMKKNFELQDGGPDYYTMAHTISEQISEQPSILNGGELKEYQLKG